jgi:hypothetical protein
MTEILALMMWGIGVGETARHYRKSRRHWGWFSILLVAVLWPVGLASELAIWAAERESQRQDEARWPKDQSDEEVRR